ncbi:MAG: hypothetical protein WCI37_01275 [bacterium]|jgi:hypothetical protein
MREKQGSPIWGGGTIGLFIGLIVGIFNGNILKSIIYGIIIGCFSGLVSLLLASIGNIGKAKTSKVNNDITQKDALKIINKMLKAENANEGKKILQKSMKKYKN